MRNVVVLIALIAMTSGCSAVKRSVGQVSHQVITCTSEIDCKTKLADDCPKGGTLYGVRQAVEIEYSCNQ
jgi:uncharacterized protein YceK